MKTKLFVCLFVVLGALSTQAQAPYKHSIGGILGFIEGGSYKTFVADNFAIQVDFGFRFSHYALGADVNGNFMYEQAIKNGFYWFAGGGLSVGPAFGGTVFSNNPLGFRLGLNAIGGAEYKFAKIPLTLQADIRPGVAFYIYNNYFPVRFDYSFFNASARYTF
ncbi:MAG: hypothetical protein PHI52_00260 [Bacteroidales bacterium]|nr:hypothetical protein [Bacteroidales bacterium]